MSNITPQVENGFVQIATEIFDALIPYRLSGEEWQVLLVILRKTYGWHKKEDAISFGQFSTLTGIKRQNVMRALHKLSSKKIIGVIKKDYSQINFYCFNKLYSQWIPVIKTDYTTKSIKSVIKTDYTLSSKQITKVSSKQMPTKDNKDIYTKDSSIIKNDKKQITYEKQKAIDMSKIDPNNKRINSLSKVGRHPCSDKELYEVAIDYRVSIIDVRETHESILDKIAIGEFKWTTVYHTVTNWIRYGKNKGTIREVDPEEIKSMKEKIDPVLQDKLKKLEEFARNKGAIS